MDFTSILKALEDFIDLIPLYVPVIPFVVLLLIYLINKIFIWRIPIFMGFIVIGKALYDIIKVIPGDSFQTRLESYLYGDTSITFKYVLLPMFLYSIVFSIVFSIVDKIKTMISVKTHKLP